ncbi:MAG: GIY-YIG nuclease family protein [Pseudomonadota bacterium]
MPRQFHVYMMTNKPNGVIYIGVTSDLVRRVYQHRTGTGGRFTKRFNLRRLVWAEFHETAGSAIAREKQLKHWNRAWKIKLIEEGNPAWDDLYERYGAMLV